MYTTGYSEDILARVFKHCISYIESACQDAACEEKIDEELNPVADQDRPTKLSLSSWQNSNIFCMNHIPIKFPIRGTSHDSTEIAIHEHF